METAEGRNRNGKITQSYFNFKNILKIIYKIKLLDQSRGFPVIPFVNNC